MYHLNQMVCFPIVHSICIRGVSCFFFNLVFCAVHLLHHYCFYFSFSLHCAHISQIKSLLRSSGWLIWRLHLFWSMTRQLVYIANAHFIYTFSTISGYLRHECLIHLLSGRNLKINGWHYLIIPCISERLESTCFMKCKINLLNLLDWE